MSPDARTQHSKEYLNQPAIHQQWETDYLHPDLESFYEDAFRRVVELLGAGPGSTLLDAGCGYCFHAARLARLGARVTGVDFSAAALAEAARFLAGQNLAGTIELRQGDLLDLPFPANTFDFVTCWGVLMHVPEVERALLEMVRVLRPGGRLALAENNAGSLHVRVWEPSLRLVKRMVGRKPLPAVTWGPRGKEEWHSRQAEGVGRGLLVRKTRMDWLVDEMAKHGAVLRHRQAGQFTEVYTSLPWRPAKRAVYAFNRWWFRVVRSPAWALGNILVFEKTRPP